MSKKAHGQIRRSQAVTTWGPGALLDLPRDAVIVGGLDTTWPAPSSLEEIVEPRLTRKLQILTGVTAPKLYAPPADSSDPSEKKVGIGVWRFPEWFIVQDEADDEARERSRRLVPRIALDEKKRFDGRQVVPTRFVSACPRGHVDDLDWRRFVHPPGEKCLRQLWFDERGTSGDLADFFVRCECGKSRPLYEATQIEDKPLGTCRGERPWLGKYAQEDCSLPARLLIRTASNAYFSQVMSVLSIPEQESAVETAVLSVWDVLQAVETPELLASFKAIPKVTEALAPFSDDEVIEAVQKIKSGEGDEKPVKQVELDALLAAPEGYGDDIPINDDFHARRLPDSVWRKSPLCDDIETVIQVHRLREVLALTGFTRFEAVMRDINGEYETDVERAELALEPSWFPAVENRGEGLFVQLRGDAVKGWLGRPAVQERVTQLMRGHRNWSESRKSALEFPGGPYVLLHTLSHLLIQSVAMSCGYPASSIRERVYSDSKAGRYGILLYTGSPDAEGTLGGLVQQARGIAGHLAYALGVGALCSNDPICAQHDPDESMEGRWLHGAACHGCTLAAETSCEMRNDYLDRALVVPTLAVTDAAFFKGVE